MIRNFTTGNNKTKNRLNEIVKETNKVNLLSQSVKRETINRIPWLRNTGGGSGIRHAYCKTAAGAGNTIVCYLDTNLTGEEVTVTCHLFESASLSSCVPLLTAGKVIPVYRAGDYWYCLWWFSGTENC